MQGDEGALVVRGRVEIDTRQPFRSVKEAVMLFGEKVLAGEICANKLKEMQTKAGESYNEKHNKFEAVTIELEETKQSLQKAKQEGNNMARHLTFLRQELEQTRKELHHLKSVRETSLQFSFEKPEIDEEIKFVENARELERPNNNNDGYERKRSVKFADSPMLTRVMVSGDEGDEKASVKKKNKKKPMIPVFGRLFSRGEQRKS